MDVVALAGLVVSAIGAAAAVMAAKYAKDSPTKGDLERVESNTARAANHIALVEQHLGEQRDRDELQRLAETVGIAVSGDSVNNAPLILKFGVDDSRVDLQLVQLTNRLNMLIGTFPCSQTLDDSKVFTATIERQTAERWFSSGEVRGSFYLNLASIRAFLSVDGRDTERRFNVEILHHSSHPEGNLIRVSGQC